MPNFIITNKCTDIRSLFLNVGTDNGNPPGTGHGEYRVLEELEIPFEQWDVSGVTAASNFMTNLTRRHIGYAQYDQILENWAAQNVQPLTIDMRSLDYSQTGKVHRDALIAKGWTINDGTELNLS
jgi:hypothetical protein